MNLRSFFFTVKPEISPHVDYKILLANKDMNLIRVIKLGHVSAMKVLLAADANPNAENEHGHTPLIEAVIQLE